ncbi:hypothetical protein MASR1M8_13670 [Thermomonas brevis]
MLHLLLPPAARLPQPLPDAVAAALGRADIDRGDSAGAALRHAFPGVATPWPVAALSRLADADDPGIAEHAWLRADPALIQPDMAGARLMATGAMLPMQAADVDAFLPALRPLFGDAGFALDAPHPQRWYLRLPAGTPLPHFPSPDEALGADAFDHQPSGDPVLVRRWRVLANEAQVVLHNHPHNARRRAAGLPPVNALWLHGAGRLPQAATSVYPTVVSTDPLLKGLARLAKVEASPPPETFAPMPTDALLDLRAVAPARLAQDWLLPALERGGEQHWTFADGPGIALRPGQRWRFWRRPLAKLPA